MIQAVIHLSTQLLCQINNFRQLFASSNVIIIDVIVIIIIIVIIFFCRLEN